MWIRAASLAVLCSFVMAGAFSAAHALTNQELIAEAQIRRLFANPGNQIDRRGNSCQGDEERQGGVARRRQQWPNKRAAIDTRDGSIARSHRVGHCRYDFAIHDAADCSCPTELTFPND